MEQSYEPLLSKDSADIDSEPLRVAPHLPTRRTKAGWFSRRIAVPLWIVVSFAILLAVCIPFFIRSSIQSHCNHPNSQLLYSPAQDAIEYKVVKLYQGGHESEPPDIYSSPPSDAVDAAWQDLYSFGVSQIPNDQAGWLVNKTMEIPGSNSQYIVLLDVFHQLHCLNNLRKALHPEYYKISPEEAKEEERHLSHCLTTLRHSIQCSSDISVIPWQKKIGARRELPQFDILHSCRNFEKIKEWALDHRAKIENGEDGRIRASSH